MSSSLGLSIDALYALRQNRLELTKRVDDLKQLEAEMREEIMTELAVLGLAKASGVNATAGIRNTLEPVVTDWDCVHAFIRENDRFDLLQKRLSAPAWRDLREAGTLVPGTDSITVQDISLTKSTRG